MESKILDGGRLLNGFRTLFAIFLANETKLCAQMQCWAVLYLIQSLNWLHGLVGAIYGNSDMQRMLAETEAQSENERRKKMIALLTIRRKINALNWRSALRYTKRKKKVDETKQKSRRKNQRSVNAARQNLANARAFQSR